MEVEGGGGMVLQKPPAVADLADLQACHGVAEVVTDRHAEDPDVPAPTSPDQEL